MKKFSPLFLSLVILLTTISTGAFEALASSDIGVSKAKSIALNDSRLGTADVTFTKALRGSDDGISVYDIEFYTPLAEYEYEINAETGAIRDKDIDRNFNIILSSKTYTYNAKAKKPSVTLKWGNGSVISPSNYTLKYSGNTNPGKATVTINFNQSNYKGVFTKTFTIKPKKGSLTTVKRVNKTQMSVKWKKDTTVSGYQLEYARDSHFSNSKKVIISSKKTTSRTLKNLKSGKKYYVRIRSYKTVNGKKIYGVWSAKKSISGSSGTVSAKSTAVSLEKAKNIALKDAGVTASNARFTKAETDYDDGIKVYEIEFVTSTKEYEYEINAKTGKIIEKSIERK